MFVCVMHTERFDHSMSKQQTRAETFANSTCRDVGHDWKTIATYRVCQRHTCRAAQRLQDGVWITAVSERPWTDPVAAYYKKLAIPQQSTLF